MSHLHIRHYTAAYIVYYTLYSCSAFSMWMTIQGRNELSVGYKTKSVRILDPVWTPGEHHSLQASNQTALLIPTLWLCRSASSQSISLSAHLTHASWAYLGGCWGRQRQNPCRSQGRQYAPLALHLPSQLCHHRWLSDQSSMLCPWESVLTTPDNHLFLHMLGDDIRDMHVFSK